MTHDVLVSEVGPRDGLQSIRSIMPLEAKKAWVAAEAAAGVREIEVGSFVPARLLPQLADTAEVVAFARTIPGLAVAVLVPNLKGAEAAVRAGAHKITLPLSKHGIIAGCLLVFIPAVGEFVIPSLLGDPGMLMIGKVLWTEFFNNRDWPVASAVAIALLLFLVIPIMFLDRAQNAEPEEGERK